MTAPHGRIDLIAPDTWRISIAMPEELFPGGFTFNQFLVVDEQPLLFHTGPRRLFPLVREQIEKVMPLERLRWVSFSHNEADECGSLAEFLAAAPNARPATGRVANMIATGDQVDVEALVLEDGQVLDLGKHRLVWQATPHLPHGWECGFFHDETTGTLFCGDLFTQPGDKHDPVTSGDILTPSEEFRHKEDYYSYTKEAPRLIEKLAALKPRLLACMHGSAWAGDGAAMLRKLGAALA
ncbi:MBL fold metallo-hydrolase [Ramlibacter sp. PS4R-6]|uniref:MBL fold metallo-hydrolase n=1 Tax=Ramlibacter sp. PS4R-6 TaxID=3133438 RepID=UPI00309A96DC